MEKEKEAKLNIIGILGKKRSGKDTMADLLVKDYDYERFGFADPMRNFVKDVFGWDDDWINNHKEEIDPEWGISYRQVMQWLGTEAFQYKLGEAFPEFKRVTGRKVWIRRFIKFIKREENQGKRWVVSDVRFPHEADEIQENGGVVVKIESIHAVEGDSHGSEMEMEEITPDFSLLNDTTLEAYYDGIDIFMLKDEVR